MLTWCNASDVTTVPHKIHTIPASAGLRPYSEHEDAAEIDHTETPRAFASFNDAISKL